MKVLWGLALSAVLVVGGVPSPGALAASVPDPGDSAPVEAPEPTPSFEPPAETPAPEPSNPAPTTPTPTASPAPTEPVPTPAPTEPVPAPAPAVEWWNQPWEPNLGSRSLSNPNGRAPGGTVAAAPGLGIDDYFAFEDFPLSDDTSVRVNIANGNLVITSNDGSTAAPGQGISLDRYYNGLTTSAGSFGGGWSSEFSLYDVGLKVIQAGENHTATFYDAVGTERNFTETFPGSTVWTPDPGIKLTLQNSPNAASTSGKDAYWVTDNNTGKRWVFTQAGWLYKVLDRNGIGYTYTLNAAAEPTGTATDVNGRTTIYNGSPNPTTATDSAGRVVKYTKDSQGRLSKVEKPGGTTTTMTYDTTGRLATITVAGSSTASTTITFGYDSSHRVATLTQKSSSAVWGAKADLITTFGYPSGQTTIKDPNNNTTTFAKNGSGLITSVKDPLNRTRSQTWTAGKSVASTTDALGGAPGNVTLFTYDALNNPVQTTLPTGAAASAVYAQGASCPGGTTGTAYQVKCSTDASGNTRSYQYDAAGNPTKQADTTGGANASIQEFTYEVAARTLCGGYAGQKCTAKDANGNVTSYLYNATGDLVKVTPPAPLGATTYTYDALSRVKTVKDGNGKTTTYTYDARDRILTTTFQNTQTLTTTYWPNGLKKSETDSAGGTKLYEYDEQGKLTKQTGPTTGLVQKYEYDPAGNLKSYEDAAGKISYTYTTANELATLTEPGGTCGTGTPASGSGCIKFSYDANGNELSRTFPGGATVTTTRDNSGRPTNIVAKNGAAAVSRSIAYSYAKAGADQTLIQTRTSTNEQGITGGAVISYSYDTRNRLTKAEEKTGTTVSASWTYGYDALGNRTSQVRAGSTGAVAGTSVYTYNAANQLTSATGVAGAWSYDAAGNQTQKGSSTLAITYGDRGQATQVGPTPQGYFGQGNTERVNSGSAISYTASALGLTSRSGSSIGNESFVRDPRGNLTSWRQGTTSHYYITDSLGSVVGMFSSNGGFEGGYSYSPYGEARSASTNTPVTANIMRFIGSPLDASGLHKLGARYMDSAIGRFTQMDPSGQERNSYTYAGSDPVNNADPTGLDYCANYAGCYIDPDTGEESYYDSGLEDPNPAGTNGCFLGLAATIFLPAAGVTIAAGAGLFYYCSSTL